MPIHIDIDREKIADFCRRWKVREFALFGSVLREDFGPKSDVDVLLTFGPGAPWGLFDLARMQRELRTLLRHRVDLIEKESLENPFRRRAILEASQVIYAA